MGTNKNSAHNIPEGNLFWTEIRHNLWRVDKITFDKCSGADQTYSMSSNLSMSNTGHLGIYYTRGVNIFFEYLNLYL